MKRCYQLKYLNTMVLITFQQPSVRHGVKDTKKNHFTSEPNVFILQNSQTERTRYEMKPPTIPQTSRKVRVHLFLMHFPLIIIKRSIKWNNNIQDGPCKQAPNRCK